MVWSPALNLSQVLANIASADTSEKLEALLPSNVKQGLANGIQAPTPGADFIGAYLIWSDAMQSNTIVSLGFRD